MSGLVEVEEFGRAEEGRAAVSRGGGANSADVRAGDSVGTEEGG